MRLKKFIAAMLSAGIMLSAFPSFAADEQSGEYKAFEQIAQYVSDRYIDDSFTKEDIMQKGLSALLENNDPLLIELLKATLSSMDDYSEFYTAEEYQEYQDQLNQTFYGIGVVMTQKDDYVEITGFVEEDGVAQRAGFQEGDKIYKVDGEDVTGWKLSDVRSKIIGKQNTTVKITVLRGGEEIELTATRVAVNEETVRSVILKGNIGYVQITSFSVNTAEEFRENLEFMRENSVENIILDLRNNGGGLVSAAVDIAEEIVPKGKIIDVKFRELKYNMTYNSTLAKKEFNFAVLVNEHTASSAEILASAMQDSDVGVLIGERTFGKAVIQNPYQLTNGMVFKLTVGQYITRGGKEINHVGLEPDIEVENEVITIDDSGYTQFDYKTRCALGNSGDNVKAAKERLYMLGFYSGSVENSVFTEDLRQAVKDFQKVNGILSYGVLDVLTQKKINEKFTSLETVVDTQLMTAYEKMGGKAEDLSEN